ncbi:MAG: tetratricopeptide repeat protein [Planctomycetaceae bacterium]|jgi:tetratricopeptide (TPR) repeat protein|nr:tetratricopeptide repeat protein [Planctomycetaceae bacterium]
MRNCFIICVVILFFIILGNDLICAERDRERVRERFWQILVESPRRGATFDRVYNYYAESNAVDQLIDKGLELSRQKPDVAGSWVLLGLIYERCGELGSGIEAFRRAVEINKFDSLVFYYLGEMLIAQGNLREAADVLDKALQNKPANKHELRSILLLLGKTSERLGDSRKADAVWSQLEQLYPNNPEIITVITSILEAEGRIDEAIKRYERYLKVQPSGYNFVRFKLAVIGLNMRAGEGFSPVGDYAELLDKVDAGGWMAEIVRRRLELYFSERNDFVGLANFYEKRLRDHPNEPAVILQLANLFVKLDRKTDALELLNGSIEKFPKDVLLRRAIIDIYVTENNFDKAITQYQQIISITPADSSVLIAWGELVMKTERADKRGEAAKIWSRLIDLSPNDPLVAIRVAELAAKYGMVEFAEKYYKRAVVLRPDDAAFREYLGFFYYSQSEFKKAVETIQSIAEGERKNAETLVLAGTLLQSIQAETEAFNAFENAVKIAPKNPMIKLKYIESLIRRHEIDRAISQLIESDQLIISDDEFDMFLRNEIRIVLRSSQMDNILSKLTNESLEKSSNIPKPVWAVGFAHEQPLRDATLACSVSGISKQLEYNIATKKPRQRLYWRLAVYNQYAGKSEVAVKMMDAAIEYVEVMPDTVSLRILQTAAELYATCGAADKAVKFLQILAAQNNIMQPVYLRQLAELQIKTGDQNAAAQTVDRLFNSGTANTTTTISTAELLLNLGRIKDAIDLLRRSSRSKPNELLIQKMLIEYLAKDGQTKNAIDAALRLFDRLDDVEGKMQLAKLTAEYCKAIGDNEKNIDGTKNAEKFRNDKLRELLYKIRILPGKRLSVLCVASVFEVLEDFVSARSELEGFFILSEGKQNADKLLLQKLVTVTKKLHDYEAAVKYQELICKNHSDSAEFDKLFILYDLAGNREKSSQLFMQQILNKTEINEQIIMIDRMICREEYDAVEHVLAFFEIHEELNWEIMYRQIVIAAYKKQKNLPELVQKFRKQKFVNNAVNNHNKHTPDDQLTKYLKDQFNNNAWILSDNLPTNDFSIWGKDSEMLSIFRQQEIFLLTLCGERLWRNPNYRTFNNVPPPKPFYYIDNFSDAKFFALCWLLREEDADKIIHNNEITGDETKRLKALSESLKKNTP